MSHRRLSLAADDSPINHSSLDLPGTVAENGMMLEESSNNGPLSVRKTIARYIQEVSGDTDLDHSSNLFEAGLLTSLDVLSLVAFIEDTFGLDLSVDDVDMDSFGTVDGLVALIDTKRT